MNNKNINNDNLNEHELTDLQSDVLNSDSLESLSSEELKVILALSEEKNKNLLKLVKEKIELINNSKEQSEKQFALIGKLANEKKELEKKYLETLVHVDSYEKDAKNYNEVLKTNEELKSKSKEENQKLFHLRNEVEEKQDKIKDLEEDSSALEKKYNTLKEDFNALNQSHTDLLKRCESLETIVLQQQSKLENATIAPIKVNKDEKDLLIEKLQEEMKSKDRIIINQMNDAKSFQSKMDALKSDYDNLQNKNNELKESIRKNKIESNYNDIFIQKNSSKGTLLGRILEGNKVDLKLKNQLKLKDAADLKIVNDEEVGKLLKQIEAEINLENKKDGKQESIEDVKNRLLDTIPEYITDFVQSILQSEATAYDYIVALNEQSDEINHLKELNKIEVEKLNKKLTDKDEELNNVKLLYYNNNQNTVSKVDYDSLIREKEDLKTSLNHLLEEQEILENNQTDETIQSLLNLIKNERTAHQRTEKLLKNEVNDLKKKLEDCSKQLNTFNENCSVKKIEEDQKKTLKFIDDVRNGKIEINSRFFDLYYEEVYGKFIQQKMIYENEIEKRNEVLKQVLEDLNNEKNWMDPLLNKDGGSEDEIQKIQNKILQNEQIISEIESILSNEIILVEVNSKQELEEKIINEFKTRINNLYRNMVENVLDKAKAFNEEIGKLNIDHVKELFIKDTKQMARYYSERINEQIFKDNIDTNEFSKLLNHARIAVLSNEFSILLNYKENKMNEIIGSSENNRSDYNEQLNNQLNDDYSDIEEVKKHLNERILDVNKKYKQEKDKLDQDIQDAQFVMNQLALQMENKESSSPEYASIKLAYDAKKRVVQYLTDTLYPEMEMKYNSLIHDINKQLDTLIDNNKEMKELYLARIMNENTINKDLLKVESDLVRVYSIHDINQFLIDLYNINQGYVSLLNNKDKQNDSIMEKLQNDLEEKKEDFNRFKNLISMRSEYERTKAVIERDYEAVRDYNEVCLEINYWENQFAIYKKEIEKCKECIKMGVDVTNNKDASIMYQAKLLTIREKLEKLNILLDDLKEINIVNQYIQVLEKLEKINDNIKN